MANQVPDAGTGMMNRQRYGAPGEVYHCPRHSGPDCDMCGGSGYRSVCNRTACHENGCSLGLCGSTQAEFDAQERRQTRTGGQDE
jgi:hypothetical protein